MKTTKETHVFKVNWYIGVRTAMLVFVRLPGPVRVLAEFVYICIVENTHNRICIKVCLKTRLSSETSCKDKEFSVWAI